MEELREKLNSLIVSKGPLDEETLNVSRRMDKLLLNYYQMHDFNEENLIVKVSA
jgi:hypothetical protein